VRRLLLVLLVLAGCARTAPDPLPRQTDEMMQRQTQAGRLTYEMSRPDEAVSQYRAALTRAQARDDLGAIGDIGFNLAVAELRANVPDRALADARATRLELERRGTTPFPALLLAEATALYRTGTAPAADAMAQRIVTSEDRDAAQGALFLRGLIADERGDEAGLVAALDGLNAASGPAPQADRAELAARLALRHADPARARQEAMTAAALRQDTMDYRGVARALSLQGEAAERSGDTEAAADLFLRAGRSAAAQGDEASARPWLLRAQTLARGGSIGRDATDLLHGLDQRDR